MVPKMSVSGLKQFVTTKGCRSVFVIMALISTVLYQTVFRTWFRLPGNLAAISVFTINIRKGPHSLFQWQHRYKPFADKDIVILTPYLTSYHCYNKKKPRRFYHRGLNYFNLTGLITIVIAVVT